MAVRESGSAEGAHVSATRPGSHARDPSVPPPVDPELTRLSVRWTHGALRTVIAVWLIAGLVGASYDALSRYGHLTWILLWGGRGGALRVRMS
jgi:hypothetical protein